jgi:hypothetical protein
MRILVAYASKHGSTAEIAEVVGETLRDGGHDVDVLAAGSIPGITPYDAVVLGSALYAAHWQREANVFVRRHLAALQARPVWLFSSGPLDATAAARDLPITPNVAETTDPIGARDHRTFSGRLLADAPGVDPQVLATHPVGDYRDFAAIRTWAAEIATTLAGEARREPAPRQDA